MKKPISQVEARRLKNRVKELEVKIATITSAYGREYPGTWITTIEGDETLIARLDTVRKLGHAIIARQSGKEIHFFAAEKTP